MEDIAKMDFREMLDEVIWTGVTWLRIGTNERVF
jgi:hypothetical protein